MRFGDRVLFVLALGALIVLTGVIVNAMHPNLTRSDGWSGLPIQGLR